MFQNPMVIEVDDAASFVSLAKDLKPKGRVIIFEQFGNGAFKFLTDQEGHLMGVQYNVQARHPVSAPNGEVTHNRDDLTPFDAEHVTKRLMQDLDIFGKEKMRILTLGSSWRKLLASSKPTTIKWTSRDPHIKNLRIVTQNKKPGVGTYTIQYTNVHVKELTDLLEKAGFKVVAGKIRRA